MFPLLRSMIVIVVFASVFVTVPFTPTIVLIASASVASIVAIFHLMGTLLSYVFVESARFGSQYSSYR